VLLQLVSFRQKYDKSIPPLSVKMYYRYEDKSRELRIVYSNQHQACNYSTHQSITYNWCRGIEETDSIKHSLSCKRLSKCEEKERVCTLLSSWPWPWPFYWHWHWHWQTHSLGSSTSHNGNHHHKQTKVQHPQHREHLPRTGEMLGPVLPTHSDYHFPEWLSEWVSDCALVNQPTTINN
jgi:hypothetical protein